MSRTADKWKRMPEKSGLHQALDWLIKGQLLT